MIIDILSNTHSVILVSFQEMQLKSICESYKAVQCFVLA